MMRRLAYDVVHMTLAVVGAFALIHTFLTATERVEQHFAEQVLEQLHNGRPVECGPR